MFWIVLLWIAIPAALLITAAVLNPAATVRFIRKAKDAVKNLIDSFKPDK